MSLLEIPTEARAAGWTLDYPLRPLHAGRELFVGACHCAGHEHGWSSVSAHHYELDVMREGMHLQSSGGVQRVMDPTCASLHAPGDEYLVNSPTRHPQRSTLLLLRGALAEELLPRMSARACYVSPAAARIHFELVHARDAVAIEETALALAHRILSDTTPARARRKRAITPSWRRLTEELHHVMVTRFRERLTVDSMAAACHASPFHASRVFRAVTGETLHRHLTRVRLRAALFMIGDVGPGRLAEIAFATGFSSHSHFTRAFRAEFGCAPSDLAAQRAPRPLRVHADWT
ncbi:helix-turn-helix transcriptional regulator [Pendulispora rubella]|uniref:Helix-turn-helix transcriptional regulator n=1 Tax=Pendulispora rubella TaxID=2741070 RepID=A0ABZ2KQK7_9BACT